MIIKFANNLWKHGYNDSQIETAIKTFFGLSVSIRGNAIYLLCR